VGHVIAVTHIAAVPSIRINFRSIPKHITKEVDLPRFEDNIVFIVHHGYLGTVAQVVLYMSQTLGFDERIPTSRAIMITVIRIEILVVVIGKTQP
jgi:hypothetical protein